MRLTLRTLLAYLDDVLEPNDAEELKNKIKESDFASGLVHRIRTSTRKLRLGAPKLEGKGVGLDANTVSEYLDGTLAHERVPDFEKVCLESDMHLAEAASCHQILTLVLGEPADVSTDVRDRIYKLGDGSDEKRTDGSSTATEDQPDEKRENVAAAASKETTKSDSADEKTKEEKPSPAKREVPDYLKAGGQRRVVPIVVTALIVFLVLSIAFFGFGPQRIASLFDADETSEEHGDDEESPGEDDKTNLSSPEPKDPEPKPDEIEKTGDPLEVKDPMDTEPEPEPMTVDPPEPMPIPGVNDPKDPAPVDPKPVDPGPVVVDPPDPRVEPEPAAPAEPVDIGRYTSEKQVFLRFDEETGAWYRLPTNSRLMSADQLLALPTYRPQIVLSAGVQLTMADVSTLRMQAPQKDGTPTIEIPYGRALAVTIGEAGSKLALWVGGRAGVATFMNADTEMAIEVIPYRPPGEDPRTYEAHQIVHLITKSGQIEWESGGEITAINAGSALMYVDDAPPVAGPLAELPDWVTSTDISATTATEDTEELIDFERPAVVSLEEAARHRLLEVRVLAAICLAEVGHYEAFVKVISDTATKSYWDDVLKTMQSVLARGPEVAANVLLALEMARGEDGQALYRLLWGYSPEQFIDGGAAELIDYLPHASMDFRVLAIETLRAITDGKTFFFRAEKTPEQQVRQVTRWRSELAAGNINYEILPKSPLLLTPVEEAEKAAPDDAEAADPK